MKVRRKPTSAELRARPAERCHRCGGRRLIVVAIDPKTVVTRPCPRCQTPEPPTNTGAPEYDCVNVRAAA